MNLPIIYARLRHSAAVELVAEWYQIYGSTVVPIASALTGWHTMRDGSRRRVYRVSTRDLDQSQRDMLSHHVASQTNRLYKTVSRELDTEFIPILAEEVHVQTQEGLSR